MTPDLELVNKVKATGDESAFSELVDRHSGVYFDTLKKYVPFNRINDTYDDFYRRKDAEIFKAVNSFDETRGVKFSSWLANQTRYSCLSERQRRREDPETIEYDENFGGSDDFTPETIYLTKERVRDILSFLDKKCKKRTGRIFEMKFFGNDGRGMSFDEIAEQEGVSSQACQQQYHKALDMVKKQFAQKKQNT